MWDSFRLKTTQEIPARNYSQFISNKFEAISSEKTNPECQRLLICHVDIAYWYICVYILTRVRCSKLSGCTTALMLSRVMSDLAPTDAYFLLRCLNIILTMFLWPIEQTRARLREKSKILRGLGNRLSASIRFSCVLAEDSRRYRLFCVRFRMSVVCDELFDVSVAFNFKCNAIA